MIALALESAVLGLVFCATPGVISAEALRRGLAGGFRRRIERELEYPGQIRVTVIRETRAVDYAK